MAKEKQGYIQCNLRRCVGGETKIQNSYLPEQFAVTGRFVKLKNAHDEWEDNWEVVGGKLPGERPVYLETLVSQRRASQQLV